MSTNTTYQGVEGRYFEGPQAFEAAKDFAKLASEQAGKTFVAKAGVDRVYVDLTEWPESLGIEEWFDVWAIRWNVEIYD